MSHFNFGNFLVDESNHEAFQVCQDVADLVPVSPLPVLIVGDEGCGKSHLLYSIVNRLRAGTAKTGLALVTANAFPSQVRSLIGDPTPVERAKSAVLLIDQLEKFKENLEELEGVVRIFLDHGHYVVAASAVHPGRLRDFPEGLRHTFESGTVATIKPNQSTPQIELIRQQIRGEQQEELAQARKEIDELRALITGVTGKKKPTDKERAAAAELKVLADQLRNALTEAENARENSEAELAAATSERDALMLRETEVLAEAEAKHQAELGPLREKLAESETRLGELEVRTEVLASEAEETKAAHEALVQERDELQAQIAALQSDLKNATGPDESVTAEIESLRAQLNAAEEARESERERLDSEHADEFARMQDEHSTLQSEHARLQEDIEALREAKEDEAGRMRLEIDRLQAERRQLDEEIGRRAEEHARDTQALHDQLAAQHAELESARGKGDEAEALRAQAEEAVSLREQLAAQHEELERLRNASDETESLREQLAAAKERQSEEAAQLAQERESLAEELGEVRLEHDRLLQRFNEAEAAIAEANKQRDEAQAARAEALERAEHVLDQVEANRQRIAGVSETQQARIVDLEQRLAAASADERGVQETITELESRLVQAEHTAEERGQALDAMKEQMQSLEQALGETRSRRDGDIDAARKESSEAIEQLDRVQRQFDETQSALELAQHRVRALEGDLAALQAEAAAQVARANTQAGETESRLARILSAFETASAENRALREELGDPNGSVENSAERLMLLAQRLGLSDPAHVARAINPDAQNDVDISI